MSENTKSYMVKDIPVNDWRQMKIKFLQDGFNNYNEALLHIIKKYTERNKWKHQ